MTDAPGFDRTLLDILVCPQTKSRLVYDEGAQELKCAASRLAYPIREGIPIMLPDEARTMDDAEVATLPA
ncbi:MAG: Trm112 family protein [Pseudomonadota bacterium]